MCLVLLGRKQKQGDFPGSVLTEQRNLEIWKVEVFYLNTSKFVCKLPEWLAATRPLFTVSVNVGR